VLSQRKTSVAEYATHHQHNNMSTEKPKTKKYILIRGSHRVGKEVYEQGDTIELTPRGARSLVNKIEPFERPAAKKAAAQKDGDK